MAVEHTLRLERVVRPDGTRESLPGSPRRLSDLSARALIAARRADPNGDGPTLSGAARAAVAAGTITPHAEAVVTLEDIRVDKLLGVTEQREWHDAPGVLAEGIPDVRTGFLSFNERDNPTYRIGIADLTVADDGETLAVDNGFGASDDFTPGLEWPFITRPESGERCTPTVHNARAESGQGGWVAAGGTWTTFGDAGAPLADVGTFGNRAHRLSDASALADGATLIGPDLATVYRCTPGRVFTVAGWVRATSGVFAGRYALRSKAAAGATVTEGGVVRTNLAPNPLPALDSDDTYLSTIGFNGSDPLQFVIEDGEPAVYEVQAAAGSSLYHDPYGPAVGGRHPVAAGDRVTVTFDVKVTAAMDMLARIGVYDGAAGDASATLPMTPADGWVRMSVSTLITAPGTIRALAWPGGTPALGDGFYTRRWVLEIGPDVSPDPADYFAADELLESAAFTVGTDWQRVALPVVVPDGIDPVRDEWAVMLTAAAGNTAPGVEWRLPQAYAGPDRGGALGVDVGVPPLGGLVLRRKWNVVRRLTGIELHGGDDVSVTAASVRRFPDADPTAVTELGAGGSARRLAVEWDASDFLPTSQTGTGGDWLEVLIEEAGNAAGGDLFIHKVDPVYAVDLTDRLVSLRVDRALEADPGDASNPIGNYAAAAVQLEADNGDRALSPTVNASIDVGGQRVETAVGVVYTNRHDDPLGEVGAMATKSTDRSGYSGTGGAVMVATPIDVAGFTPPAPRAVQGVSPNTAATVQATTRIPVEPGQRWRCSAWTMGQSATVVDLHMRPLLIRPSGGSAWAASPPPLGSTDGQWMTTTYDVVIPDDMHSLGLWAYTVAAGSDVALYLAAPVFERLDPATGDVIEVVEAAPAGLFHTTAWDAPTDAATARIAGLDVLAFRGEDDLGDTVAVDATIEAELRRVARLRLDRAAEQVTIAGTTTTLPYAFATGAVSGYLADLAKAAVLTLYVDGVGGLTALPRAFIDEDVRAQYREDNALIRAASPFQLDRIRNVVNVTGRPLEVVRGDGGGYLALGSVGAEFDEAVDDERRPRDVDVFVPYGSTVQVIIEYDASDVIAGFDVVTDPFSAFLEVPAYVASTDSIRTDLVTVSGMIVGATSVTVDLDNAQPDVGQGVEDAWVKLFTVWGYGLRERSIRVQSSSPASVDRYGARPVDVEVRLAQAQELLTAVAADVLDAHDGLNADDPTRLSAPDADVVALGDPWRDVGDRVLIRSTRDGISGEYRVLSHVLETGVGMRSTMYARHTAAGVSFAVADTSEADGVEVAAY